MATATSVTGAPAVEPRQEGTARWARFGLFGAIGAFLAVSLWWIVADASVLDFDSARHIRNAWEMRAAIADGDLLAPITQDNLNNYPPLLYLVGALGMAIGGWQSIDSALLAVNLIFAPLLGLGCWGAARQAYGDLAGVLAAVFAFGTPMVASMFHVFMLDVPQAALVAVTVWLLFASRRFERVGLSAVAGVAGAGAMLLKPTSVIFLGGVFAVVLLRGGWRQWRGLAVFLAVGAVLAGPWYVEHLSELRGLTGGAVGGATPATSGGAAPTYVTPPRWSEENVFWYGWNLLNVQLLGPLFLAFAVGTVVAIVRFWRTRASGDYTPELVIGGLVSYLGMTWISLKDPRYTLPALVFVAALGVAWVPALKARALQAAAAALVVVAAVNLVAVSAGIGTSVAIKAPGAPATILGERSVRLYSSAGYVQSAPRDDSEVLRVMQDLRAEGVLQIEMDPGGDHTFSRSGLEIYASIAGLTWPPAYEPADLPPRTPFVLRHPVPAGGPEPCGRISGDQGFYVTRMRNVVIPFESYRIACP